MADTVHPLPVCAARRLDLRFRPLIGAQVMIRSLPEEVLEAGRGTQDSLALKLISGAFDKALLGTAKSPDQLMERFSAPTTLTAAQIPLHVDVTHFTLGQWQLDPKVSLLAFFARSAEDLPAVQYAQGYFGAIIVDFRLYKDDLRDALNWLAALNSALGEITAVLPMEAYGALRGFGAPAASADLDRTCPTEIMEGLALVYGREGDSPDHRFAADNMMAAWCEALDFASLSPRLELKESHMRLGPFKRRVYAVHYKLMQSFSLYRRIVARLQSGETSFDVVRMRLLNDLEYLRWRFLRRRR